MKVLLENWRSYMKENMDLEETSLMQEEGLKYGSIDGMTLNKMQTPQAKNANAFFNPVAESYKLLFLNVDSRNKLIAEFPKFKQLIVSIPGPEFFISKKSPEAIFQEPNPKGTLVGGQSYNITTSILNKSSEEVAKILGLQGADPEEVGLVRKAMIAAEQGGPELYLLFRNILKQKSEQPEPQPEQQPKDMKEGFFDKAVGAVTGAAKGAVSGFKQGGVKGAVAGAQQQGKLEGQKKSLQADFTKLAQLTGELFKQSGKDPKVKEVTSQIKMALNQIQITLKDELGVQVDVKNLGSFGTVYEQEGSTLNKVKQVGSEIGNMAYDKMNRTPIAGAVSAFRDNVIKMRVQSEREKEQTPQMKTQQQALFKIQKNLNMIISQLGRIGQHSTDLRAKKQATPTQAQQPVKENRKLANDKLKQIVAEELEKVLSNNKK